MTKPVPGICDRCGFKYPLKDLKPEYLLGRKNGLRVCPSCFDPSHPQLDTRGLQTGDKQNVPDARPDWADREASRRMYAWNPVGVPLTSTAFVEIGRVKVVTS